MDEAERHDTVFRWFIPVVCDYSITIDKVGKSKHNKTLLRYKESKNRQHVSALLFYKAIIGSDMKKFFMSDLMMVL